MNYLIKLALKNTLFSGMSSKMHFSDKVDVSLIELHDKLEDIKNSKNKKSLVEELFKNRDKDKKE
jgi:hypothetical protein